MDDMTTIPLIDGATLRSLVLPARADAGSDPHLRAYAEVRNLTFLETTGRDDDALSAEELLPILRSDEDTRRQQWCVERDGVVVGLALLAIRSDGGGQVATWYLALRRSAQGRGIAAAAYARLEAVARSEGVRDLQLWTEQPEEDGPRLVPPTGFGSIPRTRSARFLLRHGHVLEQVDRVSAFVWDAGSPAHLRALHADAQQHAGGYRVVQWALPTPPEHVDGYAWMKSRMSTDAPTAGLSTPEETWDAERVARSDARFLDSGHDVLVTAAQHVPTGELAAFTELSLRLSEPAGVSHQEDTLVLAAHRGHRLGMLVKTAGLLAWRDRHPLSPRIVTYNAEENRPMLSINEAIGYAPIGYDSAWKKTL